jgi:hypothetical protein
MHHLGNTADRLGKAIDTRGEGGYVVAPPSSNAKGAYRVERDLPIASMPPHLLARLMERKAPTVKATEGISIEGRNNYLTKIAGSLRAQGLSTDEVRDTILALNESRYGSGKHKDGPLDEDEVERTILKSAEKWEQGKVKNEEQESKPKGKSLAALLKKDLPAIKWVVPGILPEGLATFAGKPKIGKSWWCLGIALGVAEGLVLGKVKAEQGGVLYLALEDSERRMQYRTKTLLQGKQLPETIDYETTWRNFAQGGFEDLLDYIDVHPSLRLILIDTWAKVRPPSRGRVDAYNEDTSFLSPLQHIANERHIGIVLVTHQRKATADDVFDTVMGSTGITGVADTIMVLSRNARTDADAVLNITGRDVDSRELALKHDKQSMKWELLGTAAEAALSKERREIMDVLRGSGGLRAKKIAEQAHKPEPSVRVLLGKMVESGELALKERGLYEIETKYNHYNNNSDYIGYIGYIPQPATNITAPPTNVTASQNTGYIPEAPPQAALVGNITDITDIIKTSKDVCEKLRRDIAASNPLTFPEYKPVEWDGDRITPSLDWLKKALSVCEYVQPLYPDEDYTEAIEGYKRDIALLEAASDDGWGDIKLTD